MERRKFMIGAGALATGSAAAVGTGAFSSMTASGRDANIEIVNDEDAMVALIPQLDSDTVRQEDGELLIDLDPGVNPNSEYEFGNTPIPYDSDNDESAAFHIENNDSVARDVTVTWRQEEYPSRDSELDGGSTQFRFWVGNENDDGERADDSSVDPVRGNSDTGSVTKSVAPGKHAAVAFNINILDGFAEDVESPLDFSGTFTIDAD